MWSLTKKKKKIERKSEKMDINFLRKGINKSQNKSKRGITSGKKSGKMIS